MNFICSGKIYKYGQWTFEYGMFCLWPRKKDGELCKRAGKKFFDDIRPFLKMTDKEQQEYRVGGGCQEF